MSNSYYDRERVKQIQAIFGHPTPPKVVTERQFDDFQEELVRLSQTPWHLIKEEDYWYYLMDLCYRELQQDLFDYLFPGFLVIWWEGQLSRKGGPASEGDFYRALWQGELLTKMMPLARRQAVMQWMVDAYLEGVDAWGGELSVTYQPNGPDNLQGPLNHFHALGQTVQITRPILKKLLEVTTVGRAQWWLVFGSGLVWNENECPAIPPWTPTQGGGGVYIMQSAAEIYDKAYLPENFEAFEEVLSYDQVAELVRQSHELLSTSPHGDWAFQTWREIQNQPERITRRLERFKELLTKPNLGGSVAKILDSADAPHPKKRWMFPIRMPRWP